MKKKLGLSSLPTEFHEIRQSAGLSYKKLFDGVSDYIIEAGTDEEKIIKGKKMIEFLKDTNTFETILANLKKLIKL